MKIKFTNTVYIVLAIIWALIVIVLDIIDHSVMIRILVFSHIKEFFNFLLVLTLIAYHYYKTQYESTTLIENLQKIIRSFTSIVIIYLIFVFVNIFQPQVVLAANQTTKNTQLFKIICTALLSNYILYQYIRIYFLAKQFIFYKRKRKTATYFYSFLFFAFVSSIVAYFYGEEVIITQKDLSISTVFFVICIMHMIALVLRNQWVSFLSRKNKYLFFLASIVLILFFVFIMEELVFAKDHSTLGSHSLFLMNYIYYIHFFILLYTIFTAINLLLHLPTSRVFERKMKEVQSLFTLSSAINSEPDFNKLVLMITNMVNEVTEANATWLEIYDEKKETFYIASSKRLNSAEIRNVKMSTIDGISGTVFTQRKAIIVNEVQKDPQFKYLREWKKDISSILAVPLLTTKNNIIGIIYASKSFEFGFDPDDQSILEAFANQVVIAIENAKLLKDSIQRERLEQELRIAREVQNKLLPQFIPTFNGFDIDATAYTANEVGGDYYDFLPQEDKLGIIVADVSGKGTSAAFYMAELKGIVKSLSTIYKSPKDLMEHCNEVLYETLEKRTFITASLIYLSSKEAQISFVRAGHCPLFHYQAQTGNVILHQPQGLALGMFPAKTFNPKLSVQNITYQKNDIFVLITDGLNEARNSFNDEYGDDRIISIIKKCAYLSAAQIKNNILDDIIDFVGKANVHDDMTLVTIKITD